MDYEELTVVEEQNQPVSGRKIRKSDCPSWNIWPMHGGTKQKWRRRVVCCSFVFVLIVAWVSACLGIKSYGIYPFSWGIRFFVNFITLDARNVQLLLTGKCLLKFPTIVAKSMPAMPLGWCCFQWMLLFSFVGCWCWYCYYRWRKPT